MVVAAKAVPPVDALYHFKAVPVATKSPTVAALQNDCVDAVGIGVTLTVTATVVLELSMEFNVCET